MTVFPSGHTLLADDRSGFSLRVSETPTAVTVCGALDYENAPVLRDLLLHGLPPGEGDDVVVDLGGVEFLDSAALDVLETARDRLAADGRTLRLRHVSARQLRVFVLGVATDLLEAADAAQAAGADLSDAPAVPVANPRRTRR